MQRPSRQLHQLKDQADLRMLRQHDREFSGTLAKGLMILQSFIQEPHPLGNSQLAKHLGLPRSTVSRLCRTLQGLGFLDHDDRLDRYFIGPATVALGYPYLINTPLVTQMRPAMQELAERFAGAVSISVVMGLDVVYLATAAHARGTLRRPGPGAVRGVLENAMGRAWLATLDVATRDRFLALYRAERPTDFDRCIEGALESVQAYPKRGFALNLGDAGLGVMGAGVASRIRYGSRILLFNCAGSGTSMRLQDLLDKVGPSVLQLVELAHRQASLE